MSRSLQDCQGSHYRTKSQLFTPCRLAYRASVLRSKAGKQLCPFQALNSRKRSSCRIHSTSETPATSVSTAAPTYSPHQKGSPQSQVWELDFCSRPILDERGKKRWELLVCSPNRDFEYSAYFPNNKINSTQVGLASSSCYAAAVSNRHSCTLATAAESSSSGAAGTTWSANSPPMPLLSRANADNHFKVASRFRHCPSAKPALLLPHK